MKRANTKRPTVKSANAAMLAEYDFSEGVRGKYARQYAQGTASVILEPELARLFPDSAAVNRALRTLVRIAQDTRNAIAP